jgi:hypothetical protein
VLLTQTPARAGIQANKTFWIPSPARLGGFAGVVALKAFYNIVLCGAENLETSCR